MSDIADIAESVEALHRATALAHHRAAATQYEQPFEIEGTRVCLDCFEPIVQRRLKILPHCVRCVDCQNDHDRRRAHGAA
jgi:phage/conjugal plasmid C-4 type zinc finger TraR family protein